MCCGAGEKLGRREGIVGIFCASWDEDHARRVLSGLPVGTEPEEKSMVFERGGAWDGGMAWDGPPSSQGTKDWASWDGGS